MGLSLQAVERNACSLHLPEDTAQQWLPGFILTLLLDPLHLAELSWSFVGMWFPKQQRTSVPSALERRALASKAPLFTESSPDSCAREETSPTTTVLVENPSMETSSPTRTSN